MRRNVAGQRVGAQLVSATDGSAYTDTVTVYVTRDAGVQTLGSVGGGVCTHEGHGYHTYAPSQEETDGALVAYTFVGAGAVPTTVQIYTVSYDPHDTVRLGLTALPNATADSPGGIPISSIDTILSRLGAPGNFGSGATVAGNLSDIRSQNASIAASTTAIYAAVDTETAEILSAIDAIDVPTSAQIADRILNRSLAGGSDGGRTVRDALRVMRNRWTRTDTALTVYAEDDATVAWSSVLVSSSAANPVTSSDPA